MAYTASNYSITLSNNGSGLLTPSVIRNGTLASGGTAVTIPFVESNAAGSGSTFANSTYQPGVAVQAALRAILNDIANGN